MKDRVISDFSELLSENIGYSYFELEGVCESPIEIALGVYVIEYLRISGHNHSLYFPTHIILYEDFPDGSIDRAGLLVPQFKNGNERYDFALFYPGLTYPIIIECDGHDFHEKTKTQARRDRSRDRRIQSRGSVILRFTGSEIWESPRLCAEEVADVILKCLIRDGQL